MSFLDVILGPIATVVDSATKLVQATTELIREVRPKRAEPELQREHFVVPNPSSSLAHPQMVVTVPHCMYCGKREADIKPGELCDFFRGKQ